MILIDAGPLIALFNKHDRYHDSVINFISMQKYRFVSTTAVLTEVLHMIDFSIDAQLDFLEWVTKKGVTLFEIQHNDIIRIIELTKKYADRPMDFADAILVVAAEKMGIRQIISIDSDFDIYRLPGKVKINNVFSKGGNYGDERVQH
jgi:predicted nucleic acid-binding protein